MAGERRSGGLGVGRWPAGGGPSRLEAAALITGARRAASRRNERIGRWWGLATVWVMIHQLGSFRFSALDPRATGLNAAHCDLEGECQALSISEPLLAV